MDDLAEQGLCRCVLPVPSHISCEPRLRAQQGCRTRISGVEERDGLTIEPVSFRRVLRLFRNRGEVTEYLCAHPDDGSHLAAAHGFELGIGAAQGVSCPFHITGDAKCGSAELERLRIEHFELLGW